MTWRIKHQLLRRYVAANFVLGALVSFVTVVGAAQARPACGGMKATKVGGTGPNTIRSSGDRADVIVSRGGNDLIFAGGGRDLICTGSGSDTVHGGAGRDVIKTGPGNDFLHGENGSDKLFGEGEDDVLIGGPGGEHAVGGLGNDRLYGQQQDDSLIGSIGDDVLIGEHGNDEMRGAGGNDWLRGDTGSNVFDGGPGSDWASFAAMTSSGRDIGVEFSLEDGGKGIARDDEVKDVENVAGSAFSDRLSSFGIPGATARGLGYRSEVFPYNDRKDECVGFALSSCGPHPVGPGQAIVLLEPTSTDPGVQVLGSSGDDRLQVSLATSGVVATGSSPMAAAPGCSGGGTTTVSCPLPGTAGYVMVFGDSGADQVSVNGAFLPTTTVVLDGGPGADTVFGGPGDEMLDAGYEDVAASFGRPYSPDLLDGGGGNDVVSSLDFGPDVMRGGPGSDQIVSVLCDGSTVDGGPGGSDIAGFAKDYGVRARIGGSAIRRGPRYGEGPCIATKVAASNEILEGSRADDILIGNGRSNSLIIGHQGNDLIKGLGGYDRLRGDEGRDTLLGGSGPDVLEAADGEADRRLDCGPGGGRAHRDSHDPRPRHCG